MIWNEEEVGEELLHEGAFGLVVVIVVGVGVLLFDEISNVVERILAEVTPTYWLYALDRLHPSQLSLEHSLDIVLIKLIVSFGFNITPTLDNFQLLLEVNLGQLQLGLLQHELIA